MGGTEIVRVPLFCPFSGAVAFFRLVVFAI